MECKLQVETGYKEGKSYIKKLYVGIPFRLVSVGQRKTDNKLYEMIMSSSPGILDGDEYIFNIDVATNSALQLQSQSYQRLFNMEYSASQKMNIRIGNHAQFSYVPHPVVPHENSNFTSQNQIEIGEESNLTISEIITCGRKHFGEIFKLKKFQNLTEIYYQNQLVLKDNVLIQPDLIPLQNIGFLENYTHQGSLVFYSTKKNINIDEVSEQIFKQSEEFPEIDFGISIMENNGLVVRTLSNGGEVMFNLFLAIQEILWKLK